VGRERSPYVARRIATRRRSIAVHCICSRPAECDRGGTIEATIAPFHGYRATAVADERVCRDVLHRSSFDTCSYHFLFRQLHHGHGTLFHRKSRRRGHYQHLNPLLRLICFSRFLVFFYRAKHSLARYQARSQRGGGRKVYLFAEMLSMCTVQPENVVVTQFTSVLLVLCLKQLIELNDALQLI